MGKIFIFAINHYKMNRFFLYLLLLFLPFSVFPEKKQDKEKKEKETQHIYLDASVGVSVPLGKYTVTDRDDESAGYAVTGYFIQVNADWMGKRDFGVAFQYCYQHNPFNSKAKDDTMYGTLYPLGTKGWSNHYLFAGPTYIKNFGHFAFDVRAMIGAIFSFSEVFSNTDAVTLENVHNTAAGFAWQFGIGLGYAVSDHVTIKANFGYIGASPKVDKSTGNYYPGDTITGTPPTSHLTEVNIKKPVSTFNAGAGIIYKF
jgi:hypothetical protein